jgi:intracellular multiplication protein IcmL
VELNPAAHGVERVLMRNLFYEQAYRRLCMAVFLLVVAILLLICLITYQRVAWPKPVYFATHADARPLAVVRLDQPYYEDPNTVVQWTVEAVLAIYSMDYVTWRQSLQNAADYFLPEGYQAFISALKASTNLEAVKAKRQVVSARVVGPATVVRAGQVEEGLPYSWDLKIPLLVVYQNSENEIIQQSGTVFARVERVSLLRYKDGLALSQLILQAAI